MVGKKITLSKNAFKVTPRILSRNSLNRSTIHNVIRQKQEKYEDTMRIIHRITVIFFLYSTNETNQSLTKK